jgi:hypothetical protein
MRERTGHTLTTTALVHESYLRLVDHRRVDGSDRAHFFAVAALAMRRVLVDYARKQLTSKRGSGSPSTLVRFLGRLVEAEQRAVEGADTRARVAREPLVHQEATRWVVPPG